jgi:hypothetical protein
MPSDALRRPTLRQSVRTTQVPTANHRVRSRPGPHIAHFHTISTRQRACEKRSSLLALHNRVLREDLLDPLTPPSSSIQTDIGSRHIVVLARRDGCSHFKLRHWRRTIRSRSLLAKPHAGEPLVCTTLRWREVDSNHWYRVMRSRFRERPMSPPLDFPVTEKSALARQKRRAPLAVLMVRIHFPPAVSPV